MTRFIRRVTALILCLCMLPVLPALADEARSMRFTLSAEVNPAAWPQKDRQLLESLAQLISMISLEGTLQTDEDCFDLDADLLLGGAEETRTRLHLYGTQPHWQLESNLLGDQALKFRMNALLEFAMKAYFHLEIPLQRAALLVSPYVHTSAFSALEKAFVGVMCSSSATRTIPREDVLALAEELSRIAAEDRAFTFWVSAVGMESGWDWVIQDAMAQLYDWADSFLAEDGVTVTVDGSTETWRTGDITLFVKSAHGNETAWTLTLPASPEGYKLDGALTLQHTGDTLSFRGTLAIGQEEESIVDLRLSATDLPLSPGTDGTFTFELNAAGEAVSEDIQVLFKGESTAGAFTLQQVDASTGAPLLTLSGTAEDAPVTARLDWNFNTLTGVDFFSVNDESLSTLVSQVLGPFIRGALPLLVHAPMDACQALMDLLEDSGVIGLLLSSSYESGDEWDEEFLEDEEFWD